MGGTQIWVFLSSWWSTKYNRPLKDPMLQKYTIEELMYEYFLHEEKTIYDKQIIEDAEEKIELDKLDAADAWADSMEAEFEEEMLKSESQSNKQEEDKWMEKHIQDHNEEFGDDLSINFEDD